MEYKWPEVKIEDIISNKKNAVAMGPFGSRIKTENFVETGVPVIKGQNLTSIWLNENEFSYLTEQKAEELKSSLVERGDLVFTHRGTLGQVGYIHEDSKFLKYIVSQSQMKLSVDKSKVNPLFLYYFFKSDLGQYRLLVNKSQTGVPAIARPTNSLKNIKFPMPPLEIQSKIANALVKFDQKIELNNKMISNLQEISRTLFKRWFTDFEFPNEEGEPYRSSGGKMIESEIGLIPEGWSITKLGNIGATVSKGTTPTRKDIDNAIDESAVDFIKVKDISDNGVINYKNTQKIPLSIHQNKLKRSILKENDILFSIAGTIGRVSYVNKLKKERNINQAIAFIRLSDPMYFNLVYQLLKTRNVQEDVKSKVVQGVQANVSLSILKDIRVPIPSHQLLKIFNESLDSSFKQAEELKTQIDTLSDLRDTLLPKLLSGEIELNDESEVLDDALV
ncbi:restriction endonuclease subunit S [Pontibacillus salipaludis]|uniref:Type I restriction modification protein n=1 Tax=Pontibacillus salipaludis TaxID=1697394 RepID=A0ABQ1QL19_9BACI|nr:restriction endonuclease subunit S [Pontibacillus salipaludis]GGD28885.1 type I restriction modification protein [Pontibacillus salipaludis]